MQQRDRGQLTQGIRYGFDRSIKVNKGRRSG